MKRITITEVEDELKQVFKETCLEDGLTMSQVLRALMKWYILENNKDVRNEKNKR
jgi:antitoxin component of RelBE/YafQ-DinJ toxin-antitoxin module